MGENTLARVSVSPKSELSTISTPSAVESPATKLSVTKLSPQQVLDKISTERPFQRDEVAAAFIGTPVDWELFFVSASRVTRATPNDKIFMAFSDAASWRPLVLFDIPATGYEYLRLVEKDERFRIKGIIKQADGINIILENVSLERLSDDKAKPAKRP